MELVDVVELVGVVELVDVVEGLVVVEETAGVVVVDVDEKDRAFVPTEGEDAVLGETLPY